MKRNAPETGTTAINVIIFRIPPLATRVMNVSAVKKESEKKSTCPSGLVILAIDEKVDD